MNILLVDDQPQVCEVTALHLKALGHSVTQCASGEQGLESFLADPDAFDLLVSDYAMPGMSGVELASSTRSIRPDLPLILMSGFSEDVRLIRGDWAAGTHFLKKPFRRAQLVEAITAVTER